VWRHHLGAGQTQLKKTSHTAPLISETVTFTFFQVYQQDATNTNFLITLNSVHVPGGFSAHHEELKTVHTTSGSSKQAWHIPGAVCTVLSSWWWAEKTPATCTELRVIKKFVYVASCWYTPCPKKIVPFFYFFFLGAQCVESGEVALIATRYS